MKTTKLIEFDRNPVSKQTDKQTNRQNKAVISDKLMNGNCKRIMDDLPQCKGERKAKKIVLKVL